MRKINEDKLAKLSTTNKMLDDKYGTHGTETRNEFDEQSLAWFYGNMLKERRMELKLTQREVAEKLGRDQSYIARVERGKADIQLSSFFRIASILGIQFVPSFV
ncbi:MAG: helix-turn-helix transcriptional regulator [Alistipes sp.]|nr:helix-turn-helix transcriptional regulator [Alistipes sp.]MBR5593003.1 helix-turn-helix transcriptional regulator [Bacteroidaceae bacterium]MBR5859873.1 helix-turn-helix transcriptional regulator [Bacteroidaceae bacterium]